ncbi:hypothetical protein GQ457_07G043870 [Hibiscus cannabinus]
MGANIVSPTLLSAYLAVVCLVFTLKEGYAFGRTPTVESYTIQVSSLLRCSSCTSATKALDKKSSLQVVDKHGPCSQLYQDKANIPTHAQILLQDEARVKSIHSKLAKDLGRSTNLDQTDAVSLPAKDGSVIGVGNYVVTVGLGTPKKDLTLIFDTGSHITWTQCQPCATSCYKQQDPIFNPSLSSTYSNISCTSPTCSSFTSATNNTPECTSTACAYDIHYGDESFSVGILAKDKLTLTPTDVIKDFLFGCGQNNQGFIGRAAGLIGLSRDKLSLTWQTASKYNKFFSYCLPSSCSSTGFLSFGNGGVSKSVKFTTMSTISQSPSFYGINITGISVGGQKLPISASVFSAAGAIIDSGTVITRLPRKAYLALRSEFRKLMSQYPMAQPDSKSILDTCYDFSNFSSVTLPAISFTFSGSVEVQLDATGVFYVNNISLACLAFAGNKNVTDFGIFGNTQQKTLQVVYDVAGGKLGFATGGCT